MAQLYTKTTPTPGQYYGATPTRFNSCWLCWPFLLIYISRTSLDPWNTGISLTGIQNISEMHSTGTLHLPSIFTYLPHLIGKPDSLKPSYQVSNGRYGVSMVFGIPTIRRQNTSYLSATLKSLIDGMTRQERDDSLIVVFVAEVGMLSFKTWLFNSI